MENIISQFPKLTKKYIIIICTILGVLIIGTVIPIHLLKGKGLISQENSRKYDYVSQEGYAKDSGKDLDSLVQDFGDESPKYKIYGEVGSIKFGYADSKSSPLRQEERITSIHIDCGESVTEPKVEGDVIYIEEPSEEDIPEYTTIPLGEEPVEVSNHCTVQFNIPYTNNAARESGEPYYNLNSFIVLPDGSLITVTSVPDIYVLNDPEVQVNIFENETRIVLVSGAAYFRVVQQPQGKIFSVQVNDRIFKTSGSAEFFANADSGLKVFDTTGNTAKEQVLYAEYYSSFDGGQEFLEELATDDDSGGLETGGFRFISGNGDIWIRGTNEKIESEINKTYVVAYGKVYSGGTWKDLSSAGYIEEANITRYMPEVYSTFIFTQIQLNSAETGLGKITGSDGKSTGSKVNAYVRHFRARWKTYTENQIAEIVAQEKKEMAEEAARKEASRAASYSVSCPSGYYYIGGNSCCPNGYVYSESRDKCTKTTSYSKTTKAPSYKPSNGSTGNSSSSGSSSAGSTGSTCVRPDPMPACFDMSISSGQCPNGVPLSGFYIKNGQCCHDVQLECVYLD